MRKIIKNCANFLVFLVFVSCASSKVNQDYLYFQNIADTSGFISLKERTIQPGDQINVQVLSNSVNQEQTQIFNLPNSGNSSSGAIIKEGGKSGYAVSETGYIYFPVLGFIKVVGLTKPQLQVYITTKLQEYVKDPMVFVNFSDFTVNILGEVRNPGQQVFQKDKVTIIDAISAAGDLTDEGKRQNITVIREENGKKISYFLDLRSSNIFRSPAYQLRTNDIVYIAATENKLKSLNKNVDGINKTRTIVQIGSIVLSMITTAISIYAFYYN